MAARILTGDFMLRLPLDDFWPSVHLAFAGLGIIVGNGGEGHFVSETFTVTDAAGEARDVTFTGRRVNSLRNNIGPLPTDSRLRFNQPTLTVFIGRGRSREFARRGCPGGW